MSHRPLLYAPQPTLPRPRGNRPALLGQLTSVLALTVALGTACTESSEDLTSGASTQAGSPAQEDSRLVSQLPAQFKVGPLDGGLTGPLASHNDKGDFSADGADASAPDRSCIVPTPIPSLWFALDTADDEGNVSEEVHALNSRVVASKGAQFTRGMVGQALSFDGLTYVDVAEADRIDQDPAGISFSAWVNPSKGVAGTIASHGQKETEGSWRLLSNGYGGLVLESCDEQGCFRLELPEGLPEARWSYVALTLSVNRDEGTPILSMALSSQTDDAPMLTTQGQYKTSAEYTLNIPASLAVGASLIAPDEPDDAPEDTPEDPSNDEQASNLLPVDAFIGIIDEVMYFGAPLPDATFQDVANARTDGVCQDCIHDRIAPTLTCPDVITAEEGSQVAPPEISATDNCDGSPVVMTTFESGSPNRPGSVQSVRYTAIDKSGNQSSCTSKVSYQAKRLVKPETASLAVLTGGTCTVATTSPTVSIGQALTIWVPDNSYTCTQGTCDITTQFYLSQPAGSHMGALTGAPWRLVNQQTSVNVSGSHAGFGGSATAYNTVSYELFKNSTATAEAYVVARDHGTQQKLGEWLCSVPVTMTPPVNRYCDIAIATWDAWLTNGSYVLKTIAPGETSSTDFATAQDQLIIGTDGDDTIGGGDGVNCLAGGKGNDTLYGNHSQTGWVNRMDGGPGDDRIDFNMVTGYGWGGDGIDTMKASTGGTNGYVNFHGGTMGDTLKGSGGNDTLRGDEGADEIHGHDGVDSIEGGPGNDDIWGNGWGDDIWGGDGCDEIHGNSAQDEIYGENGQDRIWGETDEDTIDGGDKRDFLKGGDNTDTLHGGNGVDWICGNENADHLYGDGDQPDECRDGNDNGDYTNCENHNGRACNTIGDWGNAQLIQCGP